MKGSNIAQRVMYCMCIVSTCRICLNLILLFSRLWPGSTLILIKHLMVAEPFSICLFVVEFLKIASKLRSLKDEILAYKEFLQKVSDLFYHVDALRQKLSTLRTIPDGPWIDCQLEQVKSALEKAKTTVPWTGETRSGVLAIIDAVEWSLKYKDAAKTHKILLMMDHNTLLNIRDVLSKVEQVNRPSAPEKYFQETRTRMLAALSKRVMRNAIMYSGTGVKTSRSRLLFEPEQQCLFSPVRSTFISGPSRPLCAVNDLHGRVRFPQAESSFTERLVLFPKRRLVR